MGGQVAMVADLVETVEVQCSLVQFQAVTVAWAGCYTNQPSSCAP